jgi:titin
MERIEVATDSKSTTMLIPSASRVDSGKYTITLESSAGEKKLNVGVKVLDTPGPCNNLEVREVTRSEVALAWQAPENDGGAYIKSYIVQKREASRLSWTTVTATCQKTSFKLKELQEGVFYSFRILAENEYGVGEGCETETAVITTEKPGCPQRVMTGEVTQKSIEVTYEKALTDGGSRIKGYVVFFKEQGKKEWKEAGMAKPTAKSYIITDREHGIKANTEYSVRVAAVNEAGPGDSRDAFHSVITKDTKIEPDASL